MGKKRNVDAESSDIHADCLKDWKTFTTKNPTSTLTSAPVWSISAKHDLSNKQRLESIKKKQQEEKSVQKIIKEALQISRSQNAPNKKIHFDSDSEVDNESAHGSKKSLAYDEEERIGSEDESQADSALEPAESLDGRQANRKRKKNKRLEEKSLFDDDSCDSAESANQFEFKKQFEGEAGRKLLGLQGRFGNDKRFKLDERFLSSSVPEVQEEADYVLGNEASKNLGILQSVLGYEIVPKDEKKLKDSTKKWVGEIPRYDPTKEDAAKLEVRKTKTEKGADESTNHGKKKKKQPEAEFAPQEELPVVSEERFYEVTTSLPDRFAKKDQDQTFSLAKSFQFVDDKGAEKGILDEPLKLKTRTNWNHNPFKYDSSSDEEEDDVVSDVLKSVVTDDKVEPSIESTVATSDTAVPAANRSTFFFLKGDKRLEDGVEFFRRHDDEETMTKKWKDNLEPLLEFLRTHRRRSLRKAKLSKNPTSDPKPLIKPKRVKRDHLKKQKPQH